MEKIEHINWESESTPVQIRKWGVMIENKINEIIDRLNEQLILEMTLERDEIRIMQKILSYYDGYGTDLSEVERIEKKLNELSKLKDNK